jgi:hypothetical protein
MIRKKRKLGKNTKTTDLYQEGGRGGVVWKVNLEVKSDGSEVALCRIITALITKPTAIH